MPSRPEDELLEQWSFLDSMVERQASALRAGAQDDEEAEPTVAEAPQPSELAELRRRVAVLEREGEALRAQLEGRDRELQRAQQHSADLMSSLREAHAAVEASQQLSAEAQSRALAAEESARATVSRSNVSAGPGAPAPASSDPPRRSAIFANQDPPPAPSKPSWLDRLLGRG